MNTPQAWRAMTPIFFVFTCGLMQACGLVHREDLGPRTPVFWEDPETELIREINRRRIDHGSPPLRVAPELAFAGRRHSRDMADRDVASHQGSDGQKGGSRIRQAGYAWKAWGEAVGCGSDGDPGRMVDFWMASPSHRRILLDPAFREVGAGYVFRSSGRYRHFWTITFGERSDVP